ncbi:MAG: 4Fe-4S dicluster domain-containing protein, partial [Promethearchaeota archaeon]
YFYGRMAKTPEEYEKRKSEGEEVQGAASLCIQCGECLEKCPQQIQIPDELQKVVLILEEKKLIKEILP